MAKPHFIFRMPLSDAHIRKIGGCSGIMAVAAYVMGSALAIALYPAPFSPLTDWTSDLGNYATNPGGAGIYNIFGAMTGLLLLPFFISVGAWYGLAKDRRFYYAGAELFGVVAAVCIFMQAAFPQGTSLHRPWSTLGLISLAFVILLASGVLLRNPKFMRPVGYYGFAAVLAFLVFFILYALDQSPFVLEWIAVYGGLIWIVLFSYNALHSGHNGHSGHNAKMTK
jgi:hypothetical protein